MRRAAGDSATGSGRRGLLAAEVVIPSSHASRAKLAVRRATAVVWCLVDAAMFEAEVAA